MITSSRSNARALAAPLLLGLIALVSAACAPAPTTPYYGIRFSPPSVGYIGKQYIPTATATSGLPVVFTLDATSAGCTLVDGALLTFDSIGNCVVNANEPGDDTHAASKQVQRTIKIYNCPPLRSGRWTGPQGLSANVVATGSSFSGTIDLSSFGVGVQSFAGVVDCDIARMTFNNVPLTGKLSPDGSTLSSSYQGISIVLKAPAA